MDTTCLVRANANAVGGIRWNPAGHSMETASPSGVSSMALLPSKFRGVSLQRISLRWAFHKDLAAAETTRVTAMASDSSASARRVVQSYASYAVPMDNQSASSFITRPLAEILRDMNKRVPDKVLKVQLSDGVPIKCIPWYHANRMLSFYAPGWSGEVRNITFSADSKTVSVVYRVTIRALDGEAWREASGTASVEDDRMGDPVQRAESLAFCRACARFGLGLYLYHEEEDSALHS